MPKLDRRLKVVAKQIRWPVHIDIGSDHGHLLKALLTAGRVERGIAVENKRTPFDNSSKTLAGLSADVRLGDGFSVIEIDEADGASICGMGGENMVKLLRAFPDRVPKRIVLQPNRLPDKVRHWAYESGFHLIDEIIVEGRRDFLVLVFQHCHGDDPAYFEFENELAAAMMYGPKSISRRDPLLRMQLKAEKEYLTSLHRQSESTQARAIMVDQLLSRW